MMRITEPNLTNKMQRSQKTRRCERKGWGDHHCQLIAWCLDSCSIAGVCIGHSCVWNIEVQFLSWLLFHLSKLPMVVHECSFLDGMSTSFKMQS